MEQSLYGYAWRHTKRQQLWMLFIVAVSIIPLFYSLNLPKLIVNGPIQGEGFEQPGAMREYLRGSIPVPSFLSSSGEWVLFHGFSLDRLQALYVLSGMFLLLVIVNGWFKYYINTYKGRLGERMLRRMRYQFVDLVLRFPIPRFKQLRASELASMIKDELEPIGGFIGDSVVTPVYLLSQVLTAIVFIFVQSVSLGFVALGVMAIQVVIIPRMRRRLLVLGRQRQLTARQFAGRVGEIVEGISSIHTNDTSNYERAGVSEELGRIFLIRFDIYQWKFLVKFLNNFLAQVTPFIFYLFGGYYAITGHMDIGQLVAVIAAYKDLPSPLKDLIDWDQTRLDVTVKYEQVVEQFSIDDISEEALQAPMQERVAPLAGAFALAAVGVQDETDGRLLDNVSTELPLRQRVAAVGTLGEGGEQMAEILARLRPASSGQVLLGDRPLAALPEAVTGRRLAYVEGATYFPRTSLSDALLYGLKHHPMAAAKRDKTRKDTLAVMETKLSGNTLLDIGGEWVDYEDAGLASAAALGPYVAEVLALVGLERDVQLFGLRSRVPEGLEAEVAETVLKARAAFREKLAASGMERYVEPFDPERYIVNATVMENVVFGAARDPRAGLAQLWTDEAARNVIRGTGLAARLFEMGRDIASTMIDLFGDLEPGNPLLQRMTVMTPDELGTYRQVVGRLAGRTYEQAGDGERVALVRLAFSYVEPLHRLGLVDEALMEKVVETRHRLRDELPKELAQTLIFYDADTFNHAATLQDNVLFGRIALDLANAGDAVEGLLLSNLDELGLSAAVQQAGLSYDLGAGAKRLSLGQQQKLALARALLKRPDYLIVNRGLSALDHETQARIVEATLARSRDDAHPFGTFWVLAAAGQAKLFDRVIEFRGGRIVGDDLVGRDDLPDVVENPEAHPEAAEVTEESDAPRPLENEDMAPPPADERSEPSADAVPDSGQPGGRQPSAALAAPRD